MGEREDTVKRGEGRQERGARGRRPRRDQRGVVLVEFAIIVPLVTLLAFGVIEFGSVYNNEIAVRQGVREAARQGVVANWGSTTSCNLHGNTGASTDIQELMCTAKNRIGLSSSSVYVMVAFDSSYATGQGLIVCAQAPMRSYTGLFAPLLNGNFYRTKVEMSIEQAPGSETAGSEDVSGISGSWSWCTASNPSP